MNGGMRFVKWNIHSRNRAKLFLCADDIWLEVRCMRIDPKSNIGPIGETDRKKSAAIAENSRNNAEKHHADRVEISHATSSQDELGLIKEKIITDVAKPADPDRLRALKAAIKNGTYMVKSEDIANAILNLGMKTDQDVEK